jgi:hypothetical protein
MAKQAEAMANESDSLYDGKEGSRRPRLIPGLPIQPLGNLELLVDH